MYTSFFGLSEKPFAITPNPRYLYMSERHAEALAHLMYGLNESGGFIQLTGEVGTGKTTIVRTLLDQLPQHADVAVILNPHLSPLEFLLTICEELGIFLADRNTASVKDLVDILNSRLLASHAKGRRVVVIVDEAQNLLPETLEQVRLLTNLETATHKLLQIILIGQPELRELLARNELRQLAQRITGRYHLEPLSRDDTAAYVRHRLKVAGAQGEVFTARALHDVHRYSHGVPRLINVICDRALLGAYTQEQREIGRRLVSAAATEVAGRWRRQHWWRWLLAAVLVLAMAGGGALWWQREQQAQQARIAAQVAAQNAARKAEAARLAAQQKPTPPPVLDVAEIFKLGITGTDVAFANLFALWGKSYDAGEGRACEQAQAVDLECVYQKGSWGQLRTLNRPAILQLSDDSGVSHQLVVVSLDDAAANVATGKDLQRVSIASVSRYWNGDYLLLWKPPVDAQRTLSVGMRGPAIGRLRQQLVALQGGAIETRQPELFDAALAQRVALFQREHRLNADGMAGLQTQIALDALVNAGGNPVLLGNAAAPTESAAATKQGG